MELEVLYNLVAVAGCNEVCVAITTMTILSELLTYNY